MSIFTWFKLWWDGKNPPLSATGLTSWLRNPDFWFAALVLGGLAFLNTWDFPIYVALFSATYALITFPAGRLVYCTSGGFYWNCHIVGSGWYYSLFPILRWLFFPGRWHFTQFELFYTWGAVLGNVCNTPDPNHRLAYLDVAQARQSLLYFGTD